MTEIGHTESFSGVAGGGFSCLSRLLLGVIVFALLCCVSAEAKTYMTLEEALERVFPEAELRRSTVFLDKQQLERARKLAGTGLKSAMVYPYEAYRNGEFIGTAYFDAHRVRTLPETLMVVVDPSGHVASVEVLSFKEPEEYMPSKRWYRQFLGRKLDKGLQLKRDVDGITGATLTSRATMDAVRRVLAIHQILKGSAAE